MAHRGVRVRQRTTWGYWFCGVTQLTNFTSEIWNNPSLYWKVSAAGTPRLIFQEKCLGDAWERGPVCCLNLQHLCTQTWRWTAVAGIITTPAWLYLQIRQCLRKQEHVWMLASGNLRKVRLVKIAHAFEKELLVIMGDPQGHLYHIKWHTYSM